MSIIYRITILFLLISLQLCAQQQFMSDVNGRPVFETRNVNIEGSPYLHEEFSIGVVKTPDGKSHDFQKVRYDAFKNELEYEKGGRLFRFSIEIVEFACGDGLFRRNFPDIDNNTNRQFYSVLYDGQIKLLKKIVVRVLTERPYNSASEVQRFLTDEIYYVLKNNQMIRIKKDKKSIVEVLSDKQNKIESFLKAQKLKFNRDEDFIKVIEHYDIN